MKILGIETSCDETAAAVVEDGAVILSNVVVSQIDVFAEYGGVIPEVAARSHLEVMMPVIDRALSDAKVTWDEIDAIAVTHAPGLLGSLLIGTLTARMLAILHDKPLYAVHHLKSHVYANWLDNSNQNSTFSTRSSRPVVTGGTSLTRSSSVAKGLECAISDYHKPKFPLLALVVSGGHTQILYMREHNQFEIIGTTRDDAVGECFDKVAKILGLPYPGGPSIAAVALKGDADKYKLPHPKLPGLDFSFSGLKTAVLRAVQKEVGVPVSYPSHKLKELLSERQVCDFAASFQKTAVDILLEKMQLALEQYPDAQSVVVAGGVSANTILRNAFISCLGSRRSRPSLETSLPRSEIRASSDFSRFVAPSPRGERANSRAAALRNTPSQDMNVFFPDVSLSGDNGAMVAAAAFYEIQSGVEPTDPYSLNIYPRVKIS